MAERLREESDRTVKRRSHPSLTKTPKPNGQEKESSFSDQDPQIERSREGVILLLPRPPNRTVKRRSHHSLTKTLKPNGQEEDSFFFDQDTQTERRSHPSLTNTPKPNGQEKESSFSDQYTQTERSREGYVNKEGIAPKALSILRSLQAMPRPILEAKVSSLRLNEVERKSKEGDKSSSKRSRREGSVSHPLPASVFDHEFHAGSRVNFHASSSQRAVIEPTSEEELLSATSARELAKRLGAHDLDRELALALDHGGFVERHLVLQADLDESRRQLAIANESLKINRTWGDDMAQEEVGKAGDELVGQSEQLSKELLEANTENVWLASELVKANETITTLDTNVAIEHEEGFNKAMPVGFKIDQDVFSGEMRPVVEAEDAEDVEDADGAR
ncbi:hypothetical protein V8G54_033098 [Vigna mungo]|uniref:Uncharacterized protein n=1 Tax=Vigna mungo TaxID=3915 RepID=A0AAQ3MN67_VIGMU